MAFLGLFTPNRETNETFKFSKGNNNEPRVNVVTQAESDGLKSNIATDISIGVLNVVDTDEHSYLLPDNTTKIQITIRENKANYRFATEIGGTANNYISRTRGNELILCDMSLSGKTIYFKLDRPGEVEILTYTGV